MYVTPAWGQFDSAWMQEFFVIAFFGTSWANIYLWQSLHFQIFRKN